MKLAYTMASGPGDTDGLLRQVADRLLADGLNVAGTVQINTDCETTGLCDMDVRVLPDGPVLRISQSRGKHARGCRLDPAVLEQAVADTATRLADADLLIVNKFGKHEASGRGFRDVIADALARDLPVLVGLNALNKDAFDAFTGGAGVALDPDADGLTAAMRGMVKDAV